MIRELLHKKVLVCVGSGGVGKTTISASIGATLFPQDKIRPEQLLKQADTAMYHAKKREHNECCFYESDS